MFAKIPGLKKADPSARAPIARLAPLPRLAPLSLRASQGLWRAQLAMHLLMVLFLILSLFPHLRTQPGWVLFGLGGITMILVSVYQCWKSFSVPPRQLTFNESGWSLSEAGQRHYLEWEGEALVWGWLIILRFREKPTSRRINLVLLPDSASVDDLRRLRVWLRTLAGRSQH